jgi:hypothetical protein
MKRIYRVDSTDESKIRGGWYLMADSIEAVRDVYPERLFPSMILEDVGEGMCIECNRRVVDAQIEKE